MPPKKARDSRRQRREERQQRQSAAQSQPQPASTPTSTSSSAAAAAVGPTSQPIDPTVLSAVLEATQRNPSSTIGLRLGSDLSVVMVPKSQHDPNSPSLSSAASQALTSVLSRKDQETGISVVTSYPARLLQPSTTVSLHQDTSSGSGGWRNFLEAPNSDDDISEPSTSSDAAAATSSSSRSSRTQHKQPKINDEKKKKKVLLEVSTTPKEQQEELASLVNLCLSDNNGTAAAAAADGDHLRSKNGGCPSTAGPAGDDGAAVDHEDDGEGTSADRS